MLCYVKSQLILYRGHLDVTLPLNRTLMTLKLHVTADNRQANKISKSLLNVQCIVTYFVRFLLILRQLEYCFLLTTSVLWIHLCLTLLNNPIIIMFYMLFFMLIFLTPAKSF